MSPRAKWIGAIALAVLIALGGWFGFAAWRDGRPPAPGSAPLPNATLPSSQDPSAPPSAAGDVVAVAESATVVTRGVTPMAERVAVLGLLNKRNGESRDLTLKPGQAVRAGNVVVRLRACERTGPWEPEQYTGAFVQVDAQGFDRRWRRAFSGWLYKERPSLNVVQHPIYDVWVKSCTMSFPEGGADVAPAAKGAPTPRRSSASNAPVTTAPPESSPAADGPSESLNNAI